MKKSLKFVLPILVVFIAIGVSVVLFYSRPIVEHQPLNIKAPLVTVSTVKSQSMSIPVFTRGTVTPGTEIQLVSEVTGQVLELSPHFANGGFFRKGEVLARIDSIEYDVNIKRSEASVAQANQAKIQADAERKARSQIKNTNQSKLATYEIQYKQAASQYEAALAELGAMKLQKERTVIRAPFDGRVRLASINVGQYLRPGQQMGSIYAVDVAEIRLPLSDRQLSLVDVPMRFQDSLDKALPEVTLTEKYAGRTYAWKGKVVRAEGGVDERNRLLYVVAQVMDPYSSDPNQPGRPELVAGSFVEATIGGREFDNIYQVPRKALRNGSQLWAVNAKGRLEQKDVAIIYKAKDYIYVSSGLQDGDKVVLSQMDIAVEGMVVRSQEQEDFEFEQEPEPQQDLFGQAVKSKSVIAQPKTSKTIGLEDPRVQALADKAKDFLSNSSAEDVARAKALAEKLMSQAEPVKEKLAPVQPKTQSLDLDVKTPPNKAQEKMSPLAQAIESDLAEIEQTLEPEVKAIETPAPKPETQQANAAIEKAAATEPDALVISTVTAPKPLVESLQ